MRSFRLIRGVNWLDEVRASYCVCDGETIIMPLGKLPLHWEKVRSLVLNNH